MSLRSAILVNLSFGLRPKMDLQFKLWSVFGLNERLSKKVKSSNVGLSSLMVHFSVLTHYGYLQTVTDGQMDGLTDNLMTTKITLCNVLALRGKE